MRKIPIHIQIVIGLILGLIWGLGNAFFHLDQSFTFDYLKPAGTIFVNLLKMIAVPLVLASLIVGVSSLSDTAKLSRIGGKTIGIYILTTVVAISIGLFLVNIIRPGDRLPNDTKENLTALYSDNISKKLSTVDKIKDQPLLQPLVDIVPENITSAAGENTKMLQVVFFAVIFGIALIKLKKKQRTPVVKFFSGVNDAITKMVEMIMVIAPVGVFALIASLIVEIAGEDINKAVDLMRGLLWYGATVIGGLAIMVFIVYPLMLKFFSNVQYGKFFRGIRPAQLLAFSTSSSNATLPITKRRCEQELGVSEEVSSFVLPLGATINMDGTSMYQGVAAVFIAQALGIDLTFADQLMILLTATLASIGSAGVPGAGMVMLIIVLESIGIPSAGLALIIGIDRILDMCRTVVNVTGDATVAIIVDNSETKNLKVIKEKDEMEAVKKKKKNKLVTSV
jgi:proton glutamate symport protein